MAHLLCHLSSVIYCCTTREDLLENSITEADILKHPRFCFVFMVDGGFVCDISDEGRTVEISPCDTVFAHRREEMMKRMTNKLSLASPICGEKKSCTSNCFD